MLYNNVCYVYCSSFYTAIKGDKMNIIDDKIIWDKECNPMYDDILSIGHDSQNYYAMFYSNGIRAITNRVYNEVLEKSVSNPLTDADNNYRHGFNVKFKHPYTDYPSKKVFMEKFNILELRKNDYIKDRCISSETFYYYDTTYFQGYVTFDGVNRSIRQDRFTTLQKTQFEKLMQDKSDLYYYPVLGSCIIQADLDMKIANFLQ